MKKGIIAITLLLSGGLFISPITTNANSIKNEINQVKIEEQQNVEKADISTEVKDEVVEKEDVSEENTYVPVIDNTKLEKVEITTDKKDEIIEEVSKEEVSKEEISKEQDQVVESNKMTLSEAQAVLNNYLSRVEQADVTYVYQGDENSFSAIKEKGIKGYVFLPNAETDMGYLVDKDNGNIYYFHPSGYFELLQ